MTDKCDNCLKAFAEEPLGVTTTKEVYLCERCIEKLAQYDMLLVQAKSYERALRRLANATDDDEIGVVENAYKTFEEWQDRRLTKE